MIVVTTCNLSDEPNFILSSRSLENEKPRPCPVSSTCESVVDCAHEVTAYSCLLQSLGYTIYQTASVFTMQQQAVEENADSRLKFLPRAFKPRSRTLRVSRIFCFSLYFSFFFYLFEFARSCDKCRERTMVFSRVTCFALLLKSNLL